MPNRQPSKPTAKKGSTMMTRSHANIRGAALLAATLVALPLSGCATGGFGTPGTYGTGQLDLGQTAAVGDISAADALTRARGHFKNNDFGYAASYYKRFVELQPNNAEGYIGLGASYDRLRRFDLADRVYVALYKITGGTAQYYNNLGYSFMLRGDLKSALENFQKAQALDPTNPVIVNNLKILANASNA